MSFLLSLSNHLFSEIIEDGPILDLSELIHDSLFAEDDAEGKPQGDLLADISQSLQSAPSTDSSTSTSSTSPPVLSPLPSPTPCELALVVASGSGAVTAPPSTKMRGEKRQRDSAVPEPATAKRPRLGHAQKVSAPTAKQPRRRHIHEGYPSASLDVTRPYACPLDGCKVSVVATKSAMNKHLRTCHDLKGMTTDSDGRISCPLCDKKMKPGSLGRHILEVEMDAEVWRCAVEECIVKMARKTSMERHIRELHPETRDTAAPQPSQGGCSHSGIKGEFDELDVLDSESDS
ncbi:hypothetical protein B0H21DRAFT_85781 [Amylocystis lapponica]|nr:hypothetical protein B0H21DRAFT_85781 [Amylocystis lapponica]